ncbi:hypothetical protein LCGC14_1274540 [marine sediment metagenome]|uniref:Uncharacterized protein n=1 Tax=marine sediment metagenome TaxID=412755 RepID=A0A0F9LI99_9ZZZZ
MKLDRAIKVLEILKYIHVNSLCIAPEIRDYLGIVHESPPSKEEKGLYNILSELYRGGYIEKIPVKRKGPGGPKFNFKISNNGSNMLAHIRDYDLLTKGKSFSELDKKVQLLSLKRILRLFSSDIYNVIESALERIIGDLLKIQFEKFDYKMQMEVVDIINGAVKSIQERTSEIATIFSSK